MSTAIVAATLEETMTLGNVLAQSGFFADSRQAAQAVVKVLAGRELGFGPIASMTGINIIKGKVALSANLMAAAIKRSGRYDYKVRELTDQSCRIAFFENGTEAGISAFTMEDAKRAGLLDGDSANWRRYPKNMLFARAISNGAKWYCPDLSGGPMYTPDELGAAIDGETGEVVSGNFRVVDQGTGEIRDDAPATVTQPVKAAVQPAQPAHPAADDNSLPGLWARQAKNYEHAPRPTNGTWGACQDVIAGIVGGSDNRHRLYSLLFGREIGSANDLTNAEAAWLLATVKPHKTPEGWHANEKAEGMIVDFWMKQKPVAAEAPDAALVEAAAANPASVHAPVAPEQKELI